MADVLTPAQRQINMSRIKGKNTKPEMLFRRALHARGLRYRLHDRSLPGRPDLLFPKYHTVVFIHGCFWHVHGCVFSKMPSTRTAFWQEKLARNAARDRRVLDALVAAGWRVLVIWGCALRSAETDVIDSAEAFIREAAPQLLELGGIVEGTERGNLTWHGGRADT